MREDHHDRFGDHVTASTGIAWTPDRGITQFRASFGQGFKAPTLYQLFGDFGNMRLNPEKARSWDAGVEHRVLPGGPQLYCRVVALQGGAARLTQSSSLSLVHGLLGDGRKLL